MQLLMQCKQLVFLMLGLLSMVLSFSFEAKFLIVVNLCIQKYDLIWSSFPHFFINFVLLNGVRLLIMPPKFTSQNMEIILVLNNHFYLSRFFFFTKNFRNIISSLHIFMKVLYNIGCFTRMYMRVFFEGDKAIWQKYFYNFINLNKTFL